MSYGLTLTLVLLASFGLSNLILSLAVGLSWRAGWLTPLARANALFTVRILPTVGSALVVLTVVLPAFVLCEPAHAHDQPGALLVASAALAVLILADGVRRGWRAMRATGTLTRDSRRLRSVFPDGDTEVSVLNLEEPLVAVVGGWRQRIVAARCVATACDSEEFRQVIAHEAAHMDARDNLKLLVLLSMPDILAWLASSEALMRRWRSASEFEADERASGADPNKRVALASALIKVARLALAPNRSHRSVRVSTHSGGIEARVRRLLAPSPGAGPPFPGRRMVTSALLVSLLAMPLYGFVHQIIEVLVAFGR